MDVRIGGDIELISVFIIISRCIVIERENQGISKLIISGGKTTT